MKLSNIKKRGRFFVVYGSNNLGKTEQVRRLASRLINESRLVMVIKYPMYNLEPSGPEINIAIRGTKAQRNKYSELDLQKLFAQNRRDFQPTLKAVLNSGVHVVAEDYTGTGIGWGMTRGIKLETLEKINADLIEPDKAILLDGERFLQGAEKRHRNEADDQKVWDKNREVYKRLARRYKWKTVKANKSIESIRNRVWDSVKPHILEKQL